MMRNAGCFIAVCLLMAGCAAPHQSQEQLTGRMDNAAKIDSGFDQDAAYHGIALDAANSGFAAIVIDAVHRIGDPFDHDATAARCAWILEDQGQRQPAEKLASVISDDYQRNQLYKHFADNPPKVSTTRSAE